MCGICGLAGPGLIYEDRKIFANLLHLSALRGVDSTGVFYKLGDKTYIDKELGSSTKYIREHHYNLYFGQADVLFGHCRDATQGTVTKENAHPFDVETLVGMHNGSLWDPEFRSPGKTDSETMFLRMVKEGIVPVLNDVVELDGYAVAIYERETDVLHLARNSHRPLFMMTNKKRDVVYFASEKCMLDFVISKYKMEVDVYDVSPLSLLSCKVSDISRKDGINSFEVTELTGKKYEGVDYKSFGYGWGSTTGRQDLPWDDYDSDECCVCQDPLTKGYIKKHKLTPVVVNKAKYYTCLKCEQTLLDNFRESKEKSA